MQLMRFLRDRSGSIAPLIAGAAIPIVGLTGAAVDYSRANSLKASLQSALDSTALALTKDAATAAPDQFSASAAAYFNGIFKRSDAQNLKVDAKYIGNPTPTVVVNASATIKTMFLNLPGIGIPQIEVGASATTSWSNARLRVALALDNTLSMRDNEKMVALKTATHSLLNQLQAAASQPGDVYVSIIPFNKDVNVGPDNKTAAWIDWSDWETKNGSCSKNSYKNQNDCTKAGKTWTAASHDNWNGCVTDRNQNDDVTNSAPPAGSKFIAEQYTANGGCPVAMIPMSQDWTALHARVDEMTPAGTTNQTIGLAWAWHSLTRTDPLNTPPKDPNYKYKDVIILLTDGMNTENRWNSFQMPTNSAVDKRTQKACDNLKATEITVYTVLVIEGSATLLEDCAWDPDNPSASAKKFFSLTKADQIITTFNAIGGQLAKLHLAK